MKKNVIVFIGVMLLSVQNFAQEIKKENDPDEQIIVNKKYDENGNLIQYDSTYYWFILNFPFQKNHKY